MNDRYAYDRWLEREPDESLYEDVPESEEQQEEEETMEVEKPQVQLTGTDGNVFALMGRCSTALKRAGQREQAMEMCEKIMASGSYDEALRIMMQYVEAS